MIGAMVEHVPSYRREHERALIREAITKSATTESIGRKLGDDLIDAAREAVGAWYISDRPKRLKELHSAINKLEALVGRP
jgi:hypothetical protein